MPDPNATLPRVTLAVLAGGAGSRMGRPKSLLTVHGQPILAYLLEQFRWPGPTLLVTSPGRERPPGAELFHREVVDPVADEGPLRGVLTALEACETDILLVTTVDMPGIGRKQLEWLVGQIVDRIGVMCRQSSGRLEPFPVVIRREGASAVASWLGSGRASVHSLEEAGITATVLCPSEWSESVWTNLNRPDDLRTLIERIG